MNRSISKFGIGLAMASAAALSACGDDKSSGGNNGSDGTAHAALVYTDPSGGKLRLVKDPNQTPSSEIVLDLVVGSDSLTGYSTGFDLPLAPGQVELKEFTPGTALAPGEPAAAKGMIPDSGPMTNMLVTAQSQKSAGTGAVATDTTLAPGTVLYKVKLSIVTGARLGAIFDGTAADFVLPSGGLRNRAGMTVVESKDVAIGKLEIAFP